MAWGLYKEMGLTLPPPTDCELVELDAQLIPALLSALAGRAGRSHWTDEAAYLEGQERLSRQGAALLMGCKEDIITEIRSARDAQPGHQPYDLTTYPVGMYPAASLATVVSMLYSAPDTAAELLVQIRDLLAASGGASDEQLELLGQMVILLGA